MSGHAGGHFAFKKRIMAHITEFPGGNCTVCGAVNPKQDCVRADQYLRREDAPPTVWSEVLSEYGRQLVSTGRAWSPTEERIRCDLFDVVEVMES